MTNVPDGRDFVRPSVVDSVTRRDVCRTGSQFIAETIEKSQSTIRHGLFLVQPSPTNMSILREKQEDVLFFKHLPPLVSGIMNGSDFLGLFTLYESECENIIFGALLSHVNRKSLKLKAHVV